MPAPRIDPATGDELPEGVYLSGKHYQYKLRVTDPLTGYRKQETRGGFLTARDAAEARERRLVETGQASATDYYRRYTVASYVAEFLDDHAAGVEESSDRTFRQTANKHIIPRLGAIRLVDLHQRQVRAWQNAVAADHGTGAALNARRVLVAALNQAVRDEIVPRNVAALAPGVDHEPKPHTILTPDQIARLLAAADDEPNAAYWYVAVLTQLRPGELAALRWEDVDLDAGELRVRATRALDATGKKIRKDRGKRPASIRTVPLPAVCVDRLRAHRARQHQTRLRMPPGAWTDRGLVFPGRGGGIISGRGQKYQIDRLCARAGLPSVTPHELRHSGASYLLSLGVDIKTISQRLGHASTRTTMEVYLHPSPEDQRRVSDRLEDDLARRRRTS